MIRDVVVEGSFVLMMKYGRKPAGGAVLSAVTTLNHDVFDCGRINQSGRTLASLVALTGEVFSPGVHVGGGRVASRHVLPISLLDAEVGGVQVQVVGGVVVLADAAALPLAQDLAAQRGGCRHVGDVRV